MGRNMTEADYIKAELDIIKLFMSGIYGFSFLIVFWIIQSPLGENTILGLIASIILIIPLNSCRKDYIKLMIQLKNLD